MIKMFRRRRTINHQDVTLHESSAEICTANCRADAFFERARNTALTSPYIR